MFTDRIWILLGKKKSGEATAEELAELESFLSNNKEAGFTNEIIEKVWETQMHSVPETVMKEDAWARIDKKINPSHSRVIHLFKHTNKWVAAAIIVVIVLTGLFTYLNFNESKDRTIASKNIEKITTPVASKSKIQLPDGTQVWLNGNSQLLYNARAFGKEKREVTLTGEAFFDVTTSNSPGGGEKYPAFVIHAGSINITVKGTAFNVKAYPQQKRIETTLIRGLIEITTNKDPERKILVKPNEKIIIPAEPTIATARQDSTQTTLYTIAQIQKDKHNTVTETVWMNNKLQFDNESFGEIIPKMESWYGVTIHLENNELKSKRFSLVIEKETLEQILHALQLSYPFNYSIEGNEIWITKK